ncbi:MAG: ribosome biosis GTP-binding protein YsxC [Verrucomicrobiota bacterium]|jgi:GTP-binding protein
MAASYLTSLGDKAQLEELIVDGKLAGRSEPRVLVVGRSNVGKSSLINALVRDEIAHVSKQPGKTRKLNFFLAPSLRKVIVDLPGYGFAKRSPAEIQLWADLIQSYSERDPNIGMAIVLTDSRHGPTEQDLEAWAYFHSLHLPRILVLTKSDELNQKERFARKKEIEAMLAQMPGAFLSVHWVSAKKGDGMLDLFKCVKEWL